MKFTPLSLGGAYLIEMEPSHDNRGYFSRTFCLKEFKEHQLVTHFVQMSTSFNHGKGQIRGMHFQKAPYQETKIVRCTKGALIDILLDLREDSPTYGKWLSETLSEKNGKMIYIPKGFAHGYKTLEDDTEILYMMDEYYHPPSASEKPFEEFGIQV